MAETQPVLASAVVIPEAHSTTSPTATKRRQSSVSETDSKRPRLSPSAEDGPPRRDSISKAVVEEEGRVGRRKGRQDEERKRGQRLFGALLGTLSQSSATAAQKKRADIEKRQHAKLKQQAEEDDLKQKEKLEQLTQVRQREQKKFDEQSMRIRHSNMLAMAQFLQTRAEPKLFYKPWELRQQDTERINRQIEEAEATINRELEDFKRKQAEEQQTEESARDGIDDEDKEDVDGSKEPSAIVGLEANEQSHKPATQNGDANPEPPPPGEPESSVVNGNGVDTVEKEVGEGKGGNEEEDEENKDNGKDMGDDAGEGELEQGEEDTVLY